MIALHPCAPADSGVDFHGEEETGVEEKGRAGDDAPQEGRRSSDRCAEVERAEVECAAVERAENGRTEEVGRSRRSQGYPEVSGPLRFPDSNAGLRT